MIVKSLKITFTQNIFKIQMVFVLRIFKTFEKIKIKASVV